MTLRAFARRVAHMNLELDPGIGWITMFDDTNVGLLPAGDFAYAGYVGGKWPTFPELQRRFPGHRLLSIAVNASEDAECLDIEKGDATIDEAPDWFKRQHVRGVYRPVLYVDASNMRALEETMAQAGIPRGAWRLWTAHYLHKAHLCAPWSCGFGVQEADGTQWTNQALGLSLDQSVLNPEFFDNPAKPPPAPASQEDALMNKLPTLKQGDKDGPDTVHFVMRVQALVKVIGHSNVDEKHPYLQAAADLATDGDFGPGTRFALEGVQRRFALTPDGVCGPKTWALLVAGWSG